MIEYIQARENSTSKCETFYEKIDQKPYFPFLIANSKDEDSIKKVAAELVHCNKVECSDLSIERVSGGNTNALFKVEKVAGGITNQLYKVNMLSEKVLVRIFGAAGMIDRDQENATYAALAAKGYAPPYYGRFSNGRIEGWLDMRTMETHEMGNYATQIAEKLAKIHANFVLDTEEVPSLWNQLNSWMKQALAVVFQDNLEESLLNELQLESILSDLKSLQDSFNHEDYKTAFCHNDLLAANILVSSDETDIQLIDFEYGGQNYIAFDIANHFNEYAGGTDNGIPNYDWYPTFEKQQNFIRAYLKASLDVDPTEKDVNKLHEEVEAFVLVNHLYWGLWAVNQAYTEGCSEFNYLLYAKHRIFQYLKLKP